MALVLGTNCGFVTVAPSADPNEASAQTIDTYAWAGRDVTDVTATKITEIGWWCDNATEAADFEVGIYNHNSGDDEPSTLVGKSSPTAKGTTAGWKSASVDIEVSSNTTYWMAVQVDDTVTATNLVINTNGPVTIKRNNGPLTELEDPFGTDVGASTANIGIYAVWEAGGTNTQINIGDTWKDVDSMKINIGDVWKDVVEVKQNIGDVWKTVF